MRAGVRRAVHVAADRLDAGGDEDVTLAGLDGVGGHADALERGGAVAVHRHARRVLEPGQDGGDAGHVVAGLTGRLGAAEDHVLHVGGVDLGHLGQHRLDDEGAQVVGPAVDQGALVGPADRGAAGGDDDGFRHGDSLLASILRPGIPPRGGLQVTRRYRRPHRGRIGRSDRADCNVFSRAEPLVGQATMRR